MERIDVSGLVGEQQSKYFLITKFIPWQIKILAKLILTRVPINYRVWQKLNLFRHGSMDRSDYAYNVFKVHFERCEFPKKHDGFFCMEMGPGDSLFTCLIAKVHGAAKTYLVDVGMFATEDKTSYLSMARYLRKKGLDIKLSSGCIQDVLSACDGNYLVKGIDSLKKIPSASVDWMFSQAVLEHIRKVDLLPILIELKRIMKPDGICSHRVDLRDHLGGALNNLRFSEEVWESDWMANSGFYTNRIRFKEMLNLFKEVGFKVEVIKIEKWNKLPTNRKSLNQSFRSLSDEDLCVMGFDVLLRLI